MAYCAESQTGESYAKALSALESASERKAAVLRVIARAPEFDWLKTLQKTKAVYMER